MRKWILPLALVWVAGVLLLILNRPNATVRSTAQGPAPTSVVNEVTAPSVAAKPTGVAQNPSRASSPAASNAVAAAADLRAQPSAAVPGVVSTMPEFTNFSANSVMENMHSVFHQYSSTFGGNPVGTNPEITQALNGGNPKQIRFIKAADGLRINGNGELVDPWGTPFFFHQLSGTQMEIHSAGPDRVMWTADDLVAK